MVVFELNNILHLELTPLLAAGSGLRAGLTRVVPWGAAHFNSLLDKMPWTVKDEVKYRNENV